jgi:hypothetical protein
MLRRGEIDVAYLLEGQLGESIRNDPKLKLVFSGGIATFVLDFFDMWDPKSPWHDQGWRVADPMRADTHARRRRPAGDRLHPNRTHPKSPCLRHSTLSPSAESQPAKLRSSEESRLRRRRIVLSDNHEGLKAAILECSRMPRPTGRLKLTAPMSRAQTKESAENSRQVVR